MYSVSASVTVAFLVFCPPTRSASSSSASSMSRLLGIAFNSYTMVYTSVCVKGARPSTASWQREGDGAEDRAVAVPQADVAIGGSGRGGEGGRILLKAEVGRERAGVGRLGDVRELVPEVAGADRVGQLIHRMGQGGRRAGFADLGGAGFDQWAHDVIGSGVGRVDRYTDGGVGAQDIEDGVAALRQAGRRGSAVLPQIDSPEVAVARVEREDVIDAGAVAVDRFEYHVGRDDLAGVECMDDSGDVARRAVIAARAADVSVARHVAAARRGARVRV